MAAAIQAVALVRLDGRTDVSGAVFGRLSIIPLWAIATPFIVRSAQRFPVLDRGRIVPASAMVHIALASLFLVVANLLIRIPGAFAPVANGGGLAMLVRSTMRGLAEYYPPAIVVYAVIVAIGHVIARREEAGAAKAEPAPSGAVAAIDGHITIRQWNRVHLVRAEDIDFVEAEDNYVVVHAASRAYKGRDRISDVEQQLDARQFVRIHRSTIVHVAKIRELQPLTHGDFAVILHDGKVLRVARSRRKALEDALGLQLRK